MEKARQDYVRGSLDPERPGVMYFPSLAELAETHDLILANVETVARRDDWDKQRSDTMAAAVVPVAAPVCADPEVLDRATHISQALRETDDRVFVLVNRGLAIAELAVDQMEDIAQDDPVKALRSLRTMAQTMEMLHRIAKNAYDPSSVKSETHVNISVQNISASEDLVKGVAGVYAQIEAKARSQGIDVDVIEGEVLEEDE